MRPRLLFSTPQIILEQLPVLKQSDGQWARSRLKAPHWLWLLLFPSWCAWDKTLKKTMYSRGWLCSAGWRLQQPPAQRSLYPLGPQEHYNQESGNACEGVQEVASKRSWHSPVSHLNQNPLESKCHWNQDCHFEYHQLTLLTRLVRILAKLITCILAVIFTGLVKTGVLQIYWS